MKRLDQILVERGLAKSREQAQAFILAGEVWSGERRMEKAGNKVADDLPLEVRSRSPLFSSRAGEKLQHALESFAVTVKDRVCIDVGASTGGFTDCLLRNGAAHVFAVDVGYGQLDQKLRVDPRVSVFEKTNARYLTLEALKEKNALAKDLSLAVVDVSFISVTKVAIPVHQALPSITDWVVLFKPQFEVGPENLMKGGIVKNEAVVTEALQFVDGELARAGFIRKGAPQTSPLPGKKSGNVELLIHYETR